MSKQTIHVNGEDKVVREDTAKAYRGTIWALISVGAFILIGAIIFGAFFLKASTDNKPNEQPSQMDQRRQQ
ncbi:MAG: hypothetical protein H0U87_03690 [Acidobacteria bacterium]|nr:hypothetical protein [Acidobacteriota bacterium]